MQLNRNADDLKAATQLGRLYVEASRADGDPRYLGYAQSVLKPWWDLARPPDDALLLRATILQSTHRFEEALKDLDALLAQDGRNGQAWLTRATVMTVLGRYAEAKRSCTRLYSLAGELVTATCLASVGSLTGEGPASYRMLSHVLENNAAADPGLRVWVRTLLGEMAARLGDDAAAETHFREAMTLAPPDGYLLGAYADFLLDHHRPDEVAAMLEPKQRNDALLLRYALALKAQHAPAAAEKIDTLRRRFAAAAMRGDTVHRREQARFELHLLEEPEKALATARLNWEVQKEPADLRILLEAALAADDKAALRTVVEWTGRTGYRDGTLAALLEQARRKT